MSLVVFKSYKSMARSYLRYESILGFPIYTNVDSWSSVCRGATLWGLEHPPVDNRANHSLFPEAPLTTAPTVTSRLWRYNYGMSLSEPYTQKKHLYQDVYRDTKTGNWMSRKQMTWLLKRVLLPSLHVIDEVKIIQLDNRVTKSWMAEF